jgi:hypothetical protein
MSRFVFLGIVGLTGALAAACTQPAPGEEVLARIPVDSADELLTRTGVTIDPEISADGQGSARIETTGTVTIRVSEVALAAVEEARLTYRARLRSRDLEGRAYLEMWCVFPDQGEFFSRALHAPLSGSVDWTLQETPFFLQKGQSPSRVKLNLAGTVWIDDVSLVRAPL